MNEVLPIRSEIFIPENKRSAWVSKNGTKIVKDRSKEVQGSWVVEGYTLDNKKKEVEVWIFDDDADIDPRVYKHNPLQGNWGYAPSVKDKDSKTIPPERTWFFPPKTAKAKVPKEYETYKHMGIWIKPTFTRDFSQLDSNSSGFMTVSGEKTIKRGEKFSVSGKWNMYGFNDDVVRGRSKKAKPGNDNIKNKWQIYVRKVDGQRFPIDTIPTHKLSVCKTKIERKKNIPVVDQRLSFNGETLKDEKTLKGSGIQDGDTIDLGPMIVYVRTRRGKKYTFEVDQDELVDDFKPRVEKREGTPVAKQRLTHKNWKLEDGKPLSQFKVRHKSVIDLDSGMEIYVQPAGGDVDKRILLQVDPNDVLATIKTMVKNRIKLPVKKQRLFFGDNEMNDDGLDLKRYGVKHLDTLFLRDDQASVSEASPTTSKADPKPKKATPAKRKSTTKLKQIPSNETSPGDGVPVKSTPRTTLRPSSKNKSASKPQQSSAPSTVKIVAPSGRTVQVPFDPAKDDKIKDIRRKAWKMMDIPLKDLLLTDPEDEEVGDSHVPSSGDVFTVASIVEVELPDKSRVKLAILPKMTVGDLKKKLEEKTGDKSSNQRVFFIDSDKELHDDIVLSKVEYPIEGKCFKVDLEPETIEVKHPDGRSFFLDLDPQKDSVKDIKSRASKLVGIPIKRFSLLDPEDEEVDDSHVPSSGDVFTVAPIVEVELPDRSKVKLTILPKMTVGDLKEELGEKIGGKSSNQRVFFIDSDKELHDDIVLSKVEYPIEGKCFKVDLEPETIEVKHPDGRSFFLDFEKEITTKEIQKQVANLSGTPLKDIKFIHNDDVIDDDYKPTRGDVLSIAQAIEVELPDDSKIRLALFPKMTVGDLKEEIHHQTGMPVSSRVFFFNSEESIPDDVLVAKALLPVEGRSLKIEPASINMTLRLQAKDRPRVFHLDLDPNMTIDEFQDQITSLTGFPVKDLRLEEGGDENELDDRSSKTRSFFLDATDPSVDGSLPIAKAGIGLQQGLTLELCPRENNEVTVRGANGRNFVFTIHEDVETVDDIKQKVATQMGVVVGDLSPLIHDGDEIDDTFKLSGGAVFELSSRPVVIELPDKSHVTLSVLPCQTFGHIKEMIQEATGLREQKMRTFFFDGTCSSEMDDGMPISEANFKVDDCLKVLSVDDQIDFPVKVSSGRTFVLSIHPDEPVGTIRKRIRDKLNFDISSFKLDGHAWDDIDDHIPVKDTRCPARLGGVITVESAARQDDHPRQKVNLRIGTTRLDKKSWGDDDDDENSLEKALAPIRHGGVLFSESAASVDLPQSEKVGINVAQKAKFFKDVEEEEEEVLQMKVRVSVPNKKKPVFFKVNKGDLVEKLQKRIERKAELIGDPCLMLGGLRLDAKKTLSESNVQHDDLIVVESLTLNIMHWEGKKFSVSELKFSDTIKTVKSRIRDAMEIEALFPLKLLHKGRELLDTNKISKEKLPHRAALVLAPPSDVVLDLPNAKKQVLKAKKVKKFRIDKEDIIVPVEPDYKQRFFIFDSSSDFDAHVTIIVIDARSGKTHDLNSVLLSEKVEKLKSLLFDKLGVAKKKQMLKFRGKTLSAKKTLQAQKLHHKAIVTMEIPTKNIIATPDVDRVEFGLSQALLMPTKLSQSINFTVQDWNGETYNLGNIPVSEYPDDLRDRIEMISGIPIDQQRLTYKKKPLDDTLNLFENSIPNGAVLKLEAMHILVQLPSMNIPLRVKVDLNDTVSKLKKKVAKKAAEKRDTLCVMFGGEELGNDLQTLDQIGLQHEDIIVVEHYKLSFMHWRGDVFQLSSVSPSDTIYDVKAQIERNHSIPISEQRMTFQGQKLNDVLSLTAQRVKHRSIIVLEDNSEACKSPVKQKVTLQFLNRGSSTLADHQDNDKLDISVRHWKGQTYSLHAVPTEYTEDIKEKLSAITGLPPDKQRLAFEGRQMEDGLTLGEQEIKVGGATLDLVPMDIIVELPNGKQVIVHVDEDDTIDHLKKLVSNSLKIKIAKSNCIVFGGNELSGPMSISDCGLEHESTVNLEPYMVSIVDATGELLRVKNIRPNDSVYDLKRKIMDLKSIPTDVQVLSLKGSPLNNELRLKDHNVKHRSVLALEEANQTALSPLREKVSLSGPGGLPKLGLKGSRNNAGHVDVDEADESSTDESPVSVASTPSPIRKPALAKKSKLKKRKAKK